MRQVFILLALTLMVSCETLFFEKRQSSQDPEDNFEYLWRECDEKYSFFEVKKIDWDSIHEVYSEKIHPGLSDDKLFSILADMLNELRDGHVNLVSNFNISFYHIEQLGPDNYDSRIILDNYLSEDAYYSGPFTHDFLADSLVAYVRFPAFTGTMTSENLDFILEKYEDTHGMIIDLRENGGGAALDIFSLMGRFVDEKTHLYDSRIKTGPLANEFSELEPAYAFPSDSQKYEGKLMILIDRGSYSASSFFALGAKALPNMTLVGDTTGGGLGLPNGGQLPNGWQYRFSVTQALDLEGNNWETGVPPDTVVIMSDDDRAAGIDPVIETAIDLILTP